MGAGREKAGETPSQQQHGSGPTRKQPLNKLALEIERECMCPMTTLPSAIRHIGIVWYNFILLFLFMSVARSPLPRAACVCRKRIGNKPQLQNYRHLQGSGCLLEGLVNAFLQQLAQAASTRGQDPCRESSSGSLESFQVKGSTARHLACPADSFSHACSTQPAPRTLHSTRSCLFSLTSPAAPARPR